MSINPVALQQMIAQDTETAAALKALMLKERSLLEAREHDELPAIIEQKDQLLNRLGENALQRRSVLLDLGLAGDAEGWEVFLNSQPTLADSREPWQQLTALFTECQTLNDINGKMIARSKQTLGNLLNILRGQTAGPTLYNQSGTASSSGGSHSVTRV